MYTAVLVIHSYVRWAVLIAALVAVARGVAGWKGRQPWTPADERAGKLFVTAFDVQAGLGLLLYLGLSPLTQAAFRNFGVVMGDSVLRFFTIEHIFGMLVALALVHIGRAKGRRASDVDRHRTAAIYFTLGLLIVLISIPWPGLPAGRPLFWH